MSIKDYYRPIDCCKIHGRNTEKDAEKKEFGPSKANSITTSYDGKKAIQIDQTDWCCSNIQ